MSAERSRTLSQSGKSGMWLLAALLLVASAPAAAQEKAAGEAEAVAPPVAEEPAPKEPTPKPTVPAKQPGPFVPTERIDAESVVSFPADI